MRRRFVLALAASCLVAVICDVGRDGKSLRARCDSSTQCQSSSLVRQIDGLDTLPRAPERTSAE